MYWSNRGPFVGVLIYLNRPAELWELCWICRVVLDFPFCFLEERVFFNTI